MYQVSRLGNVIGLNRMAEINDARHRFLPQQTGSGCSGINGVWTKIGCKCDEAQIVLKRLNLEAKLTLRT